jgi:hypothetical protein
LSDDVCDLPCDSKKLQDRKRGTEMRRIRMALVLGTLAAILAGLALGWLALDSGAAAAPRRVIYMSAVEYKGGTSSEPFPTDPAPAGGGYIIKPPDATGRWETSTYRWEPGTIMVNQGDEIELWIWGVNGALHPSYIEEYVPEFSVTRGNLTVLNFTADKAGTFRIHCSAHQPSMEAQLVVLPASAPAETPSPVPTSSPAQIPAQQLPTTGGEPGQTDNWVRVGLLVLAGLAAASGLLVLRRVGR